MQLERVVVTGMGAITPIGNSLSSYWDALKNGVSGAAPISTFDTSKFRTHFACALKDYQAELYFDKKEIKKLDAFTQYALISTQEAIENAQLLSYAQLDKKKVGVLFASGFGGVQTFEQELFQYFQNNRNPRYFSPFFVPRTLLDLAGGYISMKYGFKGVNYSTVAACASSTVALLEATRTIQLGKADVMVVCGAEASITETAIGAFSAMKALSELNEHPQKASRPFDAARDGFVMGEGSACLILESLEHAQKRQATVLAEIAGGAINADAYHITAPNPEAESVIQVMQDALEDAGLTANAIDYINAHGTSTPLGDIAEVKAIQHVFGVHAYQLNISATKSMTGHLMGAAGMVEAVASVLAIQHNIVPPTINHESIDVALDNQLNFTFNKAQSRKVDVVLSNNFGFGGHNASIIFKRY
ncbi:MAG: beta-ketoacyl-ACP synthase II [Chitinophagales bacterium]